MSDLPFLASIFLTLWLLVRLDQVKPDKPYSYFIELLAGVSMFYAMFTRQLGGVLPAALILHDLVKIRRIQPRTLRLLGVLGGLIILQAMLFPTDPTAMDRLPQSLAHLWRNLMAVARHLLFLGNVNGNMVLTVLLVSTTALLVFSGLSERVGRRATILEYFFGGYLLALVLLAARMHTRYLLPLLPLLIFYALSGAHRLGTWLPRGAPFVRVMWLGLVALLSLTAAPLAIAYFPLGVAAPAAQDMFYYIRHYTDAQAVIVFRKPRALSLFTDRKSAVWHQASDEKLLKYFDEIGATHVLTSPAQLSADMTRLIIQRRPQRFYLVHRAGEFELYRYRRPADDPT